MLREPPWYGTVCPVVWEDGGSNPASYPMPILIIVSEMNSPLDPSLNNSSGKVAATFWGGACPARNAFDRQ